MNVREEAEKLKSKGYNEDDANARICQDIILKGIAASGLSRSVTIKGGVVMRNISHNDRRATQDADLDFIKYSISDDSITEFLRKIESTIGVNITIKPPIATLKHKDYQGKRYSLQSRMTTEIHWKASWILAYIKTWISSRKSIVLISVFRKMERVC